MELSALAEQLGEKLRQHQAMLATAESCTGGWVAKEVTSVPGSSLWFDRGFVTYSNLSKQEMLGVSATTLEQHGAVSEATVREMVQGALQRSQARFALAISGIAGPGGATEGKPVGTVCLAWADKEGALHSCVEHFSGDRDQVRRQAVARALQGLLDLLGD